MFASHAAKFEEVGLTEEHIMKHGNQFMFALYNSSLTFRKTNVPDQYKLSNVELLRIYRLRICMNDIHSNIKINLLRMISPVDALTQHFRTVYLQMQTWMFGELQGLDPNNMGWKNEKGTLIPIRVR